MKKSLRIVFMGTPGFAVRILAELHQSHHSVVGVVTVADKPAGRGQLMHQSAVKQYALEQQLPLVQPEKLRDEVFIEQLKEWKADVFVVVAFRMLPDVVWQLPPLGTFNLHASLLPAYRGAAPINWALINGETKTGVTTFLINEQIDAGAILKQAEVKISPEMNVGELHDQLQELGATLTLETCDALAAGQIQALSQTPIEGKRALAPKLFKENTVIDWQQQTTVIHNLIRGLNPYPGAWCKLWSSTKKEWIQFKIFESEPTPLQCDRKTGPQAHKAGILFPCGDGNLLIHSLQMEGKKRMDAKSFMAGNDLSQFTYSDQ
ncbi:MAG: methionyl-tRNA formyltransferase [Flavobacteriales bacterium]